MLNVVELVKIEPENSQKFSAKKEEEEEMFMAMIYGGNITVLATLWGGGIWPPVSGLITLRLVLINADTA